MSGQLALDGRTWLKVDLGTLLGTGSRVSDRYVGLLSGAVVGAAFGSLLLVLAIHHVPSVARQQHEAEVIFRTLNAEELLDLRGDWMDEQLARSFGSDLLGEDEIWQEYRVIPFPAGGTQLVCAPEGGPIGTGVMFSDRRGLKTVMPWDSGIAFEILLLCSIRI